MTLLSPEGRSQLVTELRDLAIECRRTTLAGRPRTVEINARVLDRAADAIECWQPIETAPKDRRILVWSPTFYGRAVGAKWEPDTYSNRPRPWWQLDDYRLCGVIMCREKPPTHWMPLPEPPTP